MTQNEKIIALAELEGWNSLGLNAEGIEYWVQLPKDTIPKLSWDEICKQRRHWLPKYLTSHDALQPLLEKMTEEEWGNMSMEVMKLGRTPFQSFTELCLTLTPEQKADCILKACGKWKE